MQEYQFTLDDRLEFHTMTNGPLPEWFVWIIVAMLLMAVVVGFIGHITEDK